MHCQMVYRKVLISQTFYPKFLGKLHSTWEMKENIYLQAVELYPSIRTSRSIIVQYKIYLQLTEILSFFFPSLSINHVMLFYLPNLGLREQIIY